MRSPCSVNLDPIPYLLEQTLDIGMKNILTKPHIPRIFVSWDIVFEKSNLDNYGNCCVYLILDTSIEMQYQNQPIFQKIQTVYDNRMKSRQST